MATQLRPFLTDIANAIRTKKGTTAQINAQNFASEIASIPTGGGENPLQALVDGKGVYGGNHLCYYYKGNNFDFLNGIDFSKATSMSYMFSYCSTLQSVPQLDTSKITDMSYMFNNCANLKTASTLNTSKATTLTYLFSGCQNLNSIPTLDTSSATAMRNMFSLCARLTTIDITKLANNSSSFAENCNSLTKLIIRTMDTIPTYGTNMFNNCYHFTGKAHSIYNKQGLQDGRIYVPDDKVDALKAATGWSEFADIIVPLSTLVED